uniref:BMP binding endothelial regulator n=1 Tax=Oryzias latipes TaxID=8090 RepID=A0A3B3H332_ORYLA
MFPQIPQQTVSLSKGSIDTWSANGETWEDFSDPCSLCVCRDGSVQCERRRCPPLSCKNPVQRQCCMSCEGEELKCKMRHLKDKVHSVNPCNVCYCYGGDVICSKFVACRHPVTLPGECCPVCTGRCLHQGEEHPSGSTFTSPSDPCSACSCMVSNEVVTCQRRPYSCCPHCDSCLYEGVIHAHTHTFTPSFDPCWRCTCVRGTVSCVPRDCPPTVCAHPVVRPGHCCPECSDSMVSCLYQGTTYRSDEQWEVDECTSCTCVSGDVHCRSERCPPLTCASVIAPGLCCPRCIPRPATCITFGDPHYRTFDGRMFHFQGTCTYVLAKDCEAGDFSIHVTNDDRGRKGVSWTKEVTVFLGDTVNGDVVTLPFLMEIVPGSYKGHTCGLCGNFNNYHHDDLQMPGDQTDDSCHSGEDVDPCRGAGFQAKKGANTRCKVLKSAAFKPCHHVVPPEPWYGACVYDLCACGANTDECLCDTLEAYASHFCGPSFLHVSHFLNFFFCSPAVGCPLERGFVFDECGPPCPVTCFNLDVPLGVIESHCFKPCVPGCQCPAGLILHNNYCIQPEKCPKIIHGSHL